MNKMKQSRKCNMRTVEGKVWSGTWADGTVGWGVSPLVGKGATSRPDEDVSYLEDGETIYLCKCTLTPIVDKNGNPIIRKVHK